MRTMPRLVAVALLLAPLAGCCVAFRSAGPRRITPWPPGSPPEPEKMKAVSIDFNGLTGPTADDLLLPPRSQLIYRNASHWAYYRSGRFTHVRPEPAPAELHAEIRLYEEQARSPRFVRALNLLSLGLVPAWERRDIVLVTTITDQRNRRLGRFREAASVTTWHHLLLLLAFPFGPPPGVAADTVYDLNRATIAEAYDQGIY